MSTQPETGGEAAVAIRDARREDLGGILAIYNDVIATSTAVFSDQPVTLAERERWFEGRQDDGFPVLVAAGDDGEIVGFASFGPFRPWPGYRTSVEHSVHVRADRRGEGLGTALVRALIERASALGMHAVIAGVDADNIASLRLHEHLGFVAVARLPEIARKFDRWLDLILLELLLAG